MEFAVCLPMLFLLVFGSIEAAQAIHLKQTATIAAYECAQAVTASGGNQAEAVARGESILNQREVVGGLIVVSPAVDSTTPKGTQVRVTVSIPIDANGYGITTLFSGYDVSAVVDMVKL